MPHGSLLLNFFQQRHGKGYRYINTLLFTEASHSPLFFFFRRCLLLLRRFLSALLPLFLYLLLSSDFYKSVDMLPRRVEIKTRRSLFIWLSRLLHSKLSLYCRRRSSEERKFPIFLSISYSFCINKSSIMRMFTESVLSHNWQSRMKSRIIIPNSMRMNMYKYRFNE